MSEKFPGHGIVGPTGGPGPAAPTQLSGKKDPPPQKIPPKILTLLDAFDEILTLLGPFFPTKAVWGQITTVFDDCHEIFTRSSGTDPILSTQRFPRGGIRSLSTQRIGAAGIRILSTQTLYIKKIFPLRGLKSLEIL